MVDFAAVNSAALARIGDVLARWLPDGRVEGHEYVSCNPTRADHKPGSFKINMRTGHWADFATEAKGGDIVSLAAYLFDLRQVEAARHLAEMLGVHDE